MMIVDRFAATSSAVILIRAIRPLPSTKGSTSVTRSDLSPPIAKLMERRLAFDPEDLLEALLELRDRLRSAEQHLEAALELVHAAGELGPVDLRVRIERGKRELALGGQRRQQVLLGGIARRDRGPAGSRCARG